MLQVQQLAGQRPLYNDWSGYASDDDGRYIYIFGGCPPVKQHERQVTSDLFRMDLTTRIWEDIGRKMRRATNRHRPDELEPIPARSQAGLAFFSDRGLPYLLIYGGWMGEQPAPPVLISVDLTDFTWQEHSEMAQAGNQGMRRLDPALAVRGNRLYIFGGEEQAGAPREAPAQRTYSVLEYSDTRWYWVRRDVALPPGCGELGFEASAIPWDGGILVVRGKAVNAYFNPRKKLVGRYAALRADSFLNYDPATDTWTLLQTDVVGPPPPRRAEWLRASATADGAAVCLWYARNKRKNAPIDLGVWSYTRSAAGDGAGTLRRLNVGAAVEQCERANGLDMSVFPALRDNRLLLLGTRDRPAEDEPSDDDEPSDEDEQSDEEAADDPAVAGKRKRPAPGGQRKRRKKYDFLLDLTDAARQAAMP